MNVVIVNKFLSHTGGADRHCIALGRALARRGHDVAYVGARDNRDGEDELPEHAVHLVQATVTHSSRDGLPVSDRLRAATHALWNAEAACVMERLIESFEPDVVHVHKLHPQLSPAPAVVARRHGIPVVQTLHDFELIAASPIDSRGGWWDRDETRFSYSLLNAATLPYRRRALTGCVDEFVSISRFISRVYGRHGIRSTVIPSFVEVAGAERTPPPFEQRDGVLFVGRLRPEKGVNDVIHLARALPEIEFTIAGSGVLESTVVRASETLENLTAAGYVKNKQVLNGMLERARLVVIPSRCQEGANLVCLEALAHGTPVVAYANGGLGENVVESGGGIVVPVDPALLVHAVRRAYDDRASWQEMSESGHQAFLKRHAPDVYATTLEPVYERVTRARS